jgi:hypothetical protein
LCDQYERVQEKLLSPPQPPLAEWVCTGCIHPRLAHCPLHTPSHVLLHTSVPCCCCNAWYVTLCADSTSPPRTSHMSFVDDMSSTLNTLTSPHLTDSTAQHSSLRNTINTRSPPAVIVFVDSTAHPCFSRSCCHRPLCLVGRSCGHCAVVLRSLTRWALSSSCCGQQLGSSGPCSGPAKTPPFGTDQRCRP